ncbi:hypothetical protein LDENG_00069630 [Lucifuga dentata]|nr:hypothetical protein LDENG_00069630 [Lucifuga dentata]
MEEGVTINARKKTVKMSNCAEEEPMEVDTPSAPSTEEALVAVCVKWPKDDPPPKYKKELQRALQTWLNKNSINADSTVLKVSTDGQNAKIKIKPAAALSDLQTLTGQSLTSKDGIDIVTIMSVDRELSKPATQTPDDNSVDVSCSLPSFTQDVKVQLEKQIATDATAGEDPFSCLLPLPHCWYVNQIYREEIHRIERENGVKITAEVKVSFDANQKDGNPNEAKSEFTDLVQKCFGDSNGLTYSLSCVNPEGWKDALKIIQRKERKLMLTVSPEEITVFGPRESQDAMRWSLNTTGNTNTNISVGEAAWGSEDTSLKVLMSNKDPLVDAGLTMEESFWKTMTTFLTMKIAAIKAKFGVDFIESHISQGKVSVTACSTNVESTSMKSHALKALLRLYQKAVTLPKNLWTGLDQTRGEGEEENLAARNSLHHNTEAEENYGAAGYQQMSEYSTTLSDTQAAMKGGATAGISTGENKETCPICMDTFTNKKKVKCTHEFCDECLIQSIKSLGPICPVCKVVFGKMEGNQPDGQMTWCSSSIHLPGFSDCGTLIITYDIPSGTQTEKHPEPGVRYHGLHRIAYLPNNKEGKEVLHLLKRAFDQKLIFTVGTSRTSGLDNQVTWNDIHHKTATHGGPECFGYPDPGYLSRVKEELKAKGIE